MGNIFRVAVLQESPRPGEPGRNTSAVLDAMAEAAENGADILLTPECFITGYVLPVSNGEAITPESGWIKSIREKAAELSIGASVTAFMKGTERARNTALIIDKRGNIIMRYDKVHTCDFADERCLESGEEFRVCNFCGVKLGVMICYDREYPESARLLMLAGAEIILVPNSCGSMAPRLNALSTRAYENMTGVVMANEPGENMGCSCAFSPICWDEEGNCVDNRLFVAGEDFTGIKYADFDMDKLRAYRENEMMGNTFRKVRAYGRLLDGAVSAPFIREDNDRRA